MKIAFLNIFNGSVERGSEIFVSELATRLSQKHEVTVYQTGNISKKSYKEIQINGIPFLTYQNVSWNKYISQQLYHLSVALFTLKVIRQSKGQYDWIVPINGRLQTVICRVWRWISKSKILISGHAGVGFEDKINILFGNPNVFVALSPKALEWVRSFSRVKSTFIPNGINDKEFTPSGKKANIPLSSPVILCVSALLEYKRIDLLIHAVSLMKEGSLLVIGSGELNEKIKELGKKLLGNRFLLISKVEHRELSSYYRSARAFSLPSRESEAFGLVYLEALACNLPVVAPDDVNRRQIIKNAGLFCNVENEKAYAKTLEKALKTNFGNKPREVAEEFSWDTIAQKYEKCFLEN